MIFFLLIAAGIACVPAWSSLLVLLQQIPDRNDDFDLSLLGRDDMPETPLAVRMRILDEAAVDAVAA